MENSTVSKKKGNAAVALAVVLMVGIIGSLFTLRLVPFREAGQCFVSKEDNVEEWQNKEATVFRIEAVGKRNYKLVYLSPPLMRGTETDREFDVIEMVYTKTDCGAYDEQR